MRLKNVRSLLSICAKRKLKKLLKPKEEKLSKHSTARAKLRHSKGPMGHRWLWK